MKKHLPTLAALFFLLGVRTTFANQYVVPTGSMIPTIAIGDHILANRVAYDLKVPFTNYIVAHVADPARGDVVVFESPKEPGLVLVKRLVAIPGDHVVIDNGFVTLNGHRLDNFDGIHVPYRESLERTTTPCNGFRNACVANASSSWCRQITSSCSATTATTQPTRATSASFPVRTSSAARPACSTILIFPS